MSTAALPQCDTRARLKIVLQGYDMSFTNNIYRKKLRPRSGKLYNEFTLASNLYIYIYIYILPFA